MKYEGADKMKKRLLTVLLMSAMMLTGSTMVKAEDVLETNTEETRSVMSDPSENDQDSLMDLHSENIAINEKNFPDEKFRSYLQNLDTDGDGCFSQDEIDSITTIDFEGYRVGYDRSLKSLAGIEYFTSLTSLDCSHNQLTVLDMSGNPSLQTLNCSDNQLTLLDVSGNPNLQTITCSSNQLAFLDINRNSNLQTLDCSNNQLTVLNKGENSNLINLNCTNTQLTELDLQKHPNLQTLGCGSDCLKVLDISRNPNLTRLSCSNSQLTELDLSGHPSLQGLYCLNNPSLTKLNASENPNLLDLYCYNNPSLTQLNINGNLKLRDLRCGRNHLTSLDISKNPELLVLTCEYNQLKELDASNNKKLYILECKGNQLMSLDISSLELTVLDCSDNQLSNLETKNAKVLHLWCINNHLSNLDVSKNTELNSLRCYNNHLVNLDLTNNENMPIREGDYNDPNPFSFSMAGAYVNSQNIVANVVSTNNTWTLDLADIVGKENLSRVTLVTDGAELSADGTVTFSGSNIPTELVYNYDTKNPAEDTPMTVYVALTQKNIDDQTGKDVTVDTGDLDLDSICKNHNLNLSANIEIILSQDTPSKEDLDNLTQAAGANGYSITATYEILMSLFSNGQKIADITDNFGRLKLTFQVNASLAGQNAIVYQLHNNSQVIVHDGLTINTDGTVTITVDKFSSFAVAVKQSSGNTGSPNTDQSGINKPDADKPDTNQPVADKTDTDQSDTSKTGGNPSNTNQAAPMTGDSANLVFWMIVVIAAFITGILSRKRYHKS